MADSPSPCIKTPPRPLRSLPPIPAATLTVDGSTMLLLPRQCRELVVLDASYDLSGESNKDLLRIRRESRVAGCTNFVETMNLDQAFVFLGGGFVIMVFIKFFI